MHLATLSLPGLLQASSFEVYRKKTCKEMFLDETCLIIPWDELCEAIKPFCPEPLKGAGSKFWHLMEENNLGQL